MEKFTAIYKKHGRWYLGWIEEIPGINTQGRTLQEVKSNLRDAARLVIDTNRLLNRRAMKGRFVRELVTLA